MVAILNSAILNSAISQIRPFYKNTLIQTNLHLIHAHSFWLNLMMAAILNSAMLDSAILNKTLTQTNLIWLNPIHSDSTWWWQPSWSLPCWIQTLPPCIQRACYFLSDSLKSTLTPLWLWLKLIQSDSNSFILTPLDDGSHLEFCHTGLGQFSHNKTSLIPSDTTWWWQPSWILPSWIQTLPSCIQTPCYPSLRFTQKHSHSTLTLIQTNSIWLKLIHSHLNLMMAAILNSAILNLDILETTILVFPLKVTHTC